MNNANDESPDEPRTGWFFSRGTLVTCIALTTVGILLLTGHKAHLLGFAPYLLILACPLMHFFMHGRHHHTPKPAREDHGDTNSSAVGPREKP
ncbi:MAG: DUF2933 domain-containing protein [Gammaproteobacteria bacterium]|nr:DUF2933 domain-containing protein [Gammaproteobacteria bacterium]